MKICKVSKFLRLKLGFLKEILRLRPKIAFLWGIPIMRFLVPPPPTHPPLQKMKKLKMTRYQNFPLEFHLAHELYSCARKPVESESIYLGLKVYTFC